MNIELINSLWDKTELINKHWIWKGSLVDNKYGKIYYNKTYWLIHRWSLCIYLKLKYNDNSWDACHICEYKNCWNPLHLYVGTASSNALDLVITGKHYWANRTHCPKGHYYSKENTYVDTQGKRRCRVCDKIRHKK